jgi:putative (di)nucleoside polyphosphate hydrolase
LEDIIVAGRIEIRRGQTTVFDKGREDAVRAQRPIDKNEKYRKGVRIMLLNSGGVVFVARRSNPAEEGWQMPQGGIDDREDPRAAAFRELKGEIGTDNAEIIEEGHDWVHYDFPDEVRLRTRNGRIGQRQKWFVMRFKGEDSEINLRTSHPEFADWKWVGVQELPSLVVSFKRQVYLNLLSEFGTIAFGADERIAELLKQPIVQLTMAADSVQEKELYELLRALPPIYDEADPPNSGASVSAGSAGREAAADRRKWAPPGDADAPRHRELPRCVGLLARQEEREP